MSKISQIHDRGYLDKNNIKRNCRPFWLNGSLQNSTGLNVSINSYLFCQKALCMSLVWHSFDFHQTHKPARGLHFPSIIDFTSLYVECNLCWLTHPPSGMPQLLSSSKLAPFWGGKKTPPRRTWSLQACKVHRMLKMPSGFKVSLLMTSFLVFFVSSWGGGFCATCRSVMKASLGCRRSCVWLGQGW